MAGIANLWRISAIALITSALCEAAILADATGLVVLNTSSIPTTLITLMSQLLAVGSIGFLYNRHRDFYVSAVSLWIARTVAVRGVFVTPASVPAEIATALLSVATSLGMATVLLIASLKMSSR